MDNERIGNHIVC